MAEAERNFTWKNSSNSGIGAKYYNLIGFDTDASFLASFTNLFIGEVMRLDAIDLPLFAVYAEHTGKSKVKPFVKLQHVMQTQSSKIQETDLEIGIKHLTKHIRCTGIFSRIATSALSEDYYMARIELRMAI
ncbi:MAG: hypothetical protein IPO21_07640 [Bacteroidales bacterium]|nr:hypothetical protein [Bacteroidales bacterium]